MRSTPSISFLTECDVCNIIHTGNFAFLCSVRGGRRRIECIVRYIIFIQDTYFFPQPKEDRNTQQKDPEGGCDYKMKRKAREEARAATTDANRNDAWRGAALPSAWLCAVVPAWSADNSSMLPGHTKAAPSQRPASSSSREGPTT
jgi:hypothetical protein